MTTWKFMDLNKKIWKISISAILVITICSGFVCAQCVGKLTTKLRWSGRSISSNSITKIKNTGALKAITWLEAEIGSSKKRSSVIALGKSCPFAETWRKSHKEKEFPDGFMWGAASSSYQIEGAWNVDGKGESIWDHACHSNPEVIKDRSNGDTAADSYNLYKEDVRALKETGLKYYRFSISWPRILPNGSHTNINDLGIQHYDDLINELLANGIQPIVTMFHWELPQALQEMGGMLNPVIVNYFVQYAKILLEYFGDRVKIWTTFNEPGIFCEFGYGEALQAPFVKSNGVGPYLCNYHVLLANARVYRMYHDHYNIDKIGKMGIVLQSQHYFPKDPKNPKDVEAVDRSLQFWLGQYSHPIFSKTGGYPQIMIDVIGNNSLNEGLKVSRLPIIDDEHKKLIRGTSDYFFLNYYTSSNVEFGNASTAQVWPKPSFSNDLYVSTTQDDDWPRSATSWLRSVPQGLRGLLNWIKEEYDNPPVLILENGWPDHGEIEDTGREMNLKGHLKALLDAIVEDGCKVLGHTTWSLIDTFEWTSGYTTRYGLYHVDFASVNKTRTAKNSSKFLRNVIETRKIPAD